MYIGSKLQSAPMDMSKFDPANAALVANVYLKSITDPRRRQILINFRDHALAECMGDHEALMATCSKKGQRYEAYAGDGGMNMELMTHIEPHEVPEQFFTGPRQVADFFAENPGLDWPEK